MNNDLITIINRIIEKRIASNSFIKTIPCTVIDASNDEKVQVSLNTNGAVYTVQNRSGSSLNNGENVSLYYSGSIIGNNAYIGASLNKQDGGSSDVNYIIENLESLVDVDNPKTIDRMLAELDNLKRQLAININNKGVVASSSEKYNTLVDKVDLIEIGGGAQTAGIITHDMIGSVGVAGIMKTAEEA